MSYCHKIYCIIDRLLQNNYLPNRDTLILIAVLIAAPAFGARRVTTTTGNALQAIKCSNETCNKNSPLISEDIQISKPWEKLLDPNQKEFWNEGKHVPDAGFVEWATNPTLENAKLYLIRMNAKRDRLHIMVKQQEQANKELIAAGIIANDYDFITEKLSSSYPPKKRPEKTLLNQKVGHIWFYFHPDCPHCKSQAEILKGHPNVSPIQVAGDRLHNFKGLQKSLWAEKEDLKRYVPDGHVPVLVIYNPKTNKIASLKGVQSIAKINKASATLGADKTGKGKAK